MTALKHHTHPVPGLANALRRHREALGFSLRQAARLTGLSHTHIRHIEDADSNPSVGAFLDLCEAYGTHPADMLRDLLTPTT